MGGGVLIAGWMGIAGIDGGSGGGAGGCDSPIRVRTGKYKPQTTEKILSFTPAFYQSDSKPVDSIVGSRNSEVGMRNTPDWEAGG
ncbi:MAG TPA: hypothetical protein VII34_01855 [Pyrinomonadaceae bacterium]